MTHVAVCVAAATREGVVAPGCCSRRRRVVLSSLDLSRPLSLSVCVCGRRDARFSCDTVLHRGNPSAAAQDTHCKTTVLCVTAAREGGRRPSRQQQRHDQVTHCVDHTRGSVVVAAAGKGVATPHATRLVVVFALCGGSCVCVCMWMVRASPATQYTAQHDERDISLHTLFWPHTYSSTAYIHGSSVLQQQRRPTQLASSSRGALSLSPPLCVWSVPVSPATLSTAVLYIIRSNYTRDMQTLLA
jgi:hypothetical protein